jgi:Protein of unknown function (DUF3309)
VRRSTRYSSATIEAYLNQTWNRRARATVLYAVETFLPTAMLGTILPIILIILLIGSLPTWGYSGGWGYYPSGGLGLLLVIIIVLLALGRI